MPATVAACVCGADPTFHVHETSGRVRWAATITCRVPSCRANASGTGSTRRKAGKVVIARWGQILAERHAAARLHATTERTTP